MLGLKSRKATLVVVAVLLVAIASATELHAILSFRAEKRSLSGVSNFGRINDHLYRGAQPTSEGFRALARTGVQTVVRLSLGQEGAESERSEVEALGMQSISLPWSAMGEPDRDQIVRFFQVLRNDPHRVVFVHCRSGADRTGMMIAISRIALDGWTPSRALDEMRAFHYLDVFHWQLRALVSDFPDRIRRDPGLIAPPTL